MGGIDLKEMEREISNGMQIVEVGSKEESWVRFAVGESDGWRSQKASFALSHPSKKLSIEVFIAEKIRI